MIDGFWRKLSGGKKDKSKDVAKKRLKFTLIYDKLEVSDDILDDLQKDIVNVISRYFEIDHNSFQLSINRSENHSALVFNTPILSAIRKRSTTPEIKTQVLVEKPASPVD